MQHTKQKAYIRPIRQSFQDQVSGQMPLILVAYLLQVIEFCVFSIRVPAPVSFEEHRGL